MAELDRRLRILDFDIENRPLAYLGGDFTTGEVTAIAWAWVGQTKLPEVRLLGKDTMGDILEAFVRVYNQADIVTGHYIREHDLPVINGALMEQRRRGLDEKRVSDTKIDLVSRRHISASQENLAAMLGVKSPKVCLNNTEWREANRLTPKGLKITAARVAGDVLQHMELRLKLSELGLLGAPSMWRP